MPSVLYFQQFVQHHITLSLGLFSDIFKPFWRASNAVERTITNGRSIRLFDRQSHSYCRKSRLHGSQYRKNQQNPTHTIEPCFTVFQKSDAKLQITITTAYLIRINYPLSSFNYRLSGTNIANFNKIHHMVSEQRLLKKWNLKTELSNMENTN